jgi:hypothetical protein
MLVITSLDLPPLGPHQVNLDGMRFKLGVRAFIGLGPVDAMRQYRLYVSFQFDDENLEPVDVSFDDKFPEHALPDAALDLRLLRERDQDEAVMSAHDILIQPHARLYARCVGGEVRFGLDLGGFRTNAAASKGEMSSVLDIFRDLPDDGRPGKYF